MEWKRDISVGPKSSKYAFLTRHYIVGTEKYPLITISLYRDHLEKKGSDTVKIACNMKDSIDDWWNEVNIPNSLVGEVIDMLKEYKESIEYKGQNNDA